MIFLTSGILLFFFYVTFRVALLDTEICVCKRRGFVPLFFFPSKQSGSDDNLAYLKCLNDYTKMNHTWPEVLVSYSQLHSAVAL